MKTSCENFPDEKEPLFSKRTKKYLYLQYFVLEYLILVLVLLVHLYVAYGWSLSKKLFGWVLPTSTWCRNSSSIVIISTIVSTGSLVSIIRVVLVLET